jgi:hypothetical protein
MFTKNGDRVEVGIGCRISELGHVFGLLKRMKINSEIGLGKDAKLEVIEREYRRGLHFKFGHHNSAKFVSEQSCGNKQKMS